MNFTSLKISVLAEGTSRDTHLSTTLTTRLKSQTALSSSSRSLMMIFREAKQVKFQVMMQVKQQVMLQVMLQVKSKDL